METPDAVILIDHGSRAPAAMEDLRAVARMTAERMGVPVYPAHMDVAPPSLADALAEAVAAGARRVVVCPYFLGPGRHALRDVPAMAREAAASYSDITVWVAGPLGPAPLLAELVCLRVRGALGGEPLP